MVPDADSARREVSAAIVRSACATPSFTASRATMHCTSVDGSTRRNGLSESSTREKTSPPASSAAPLRRIGPTSARIVPEASATKRSADGSGPSRSIDSVVTPPVALRPGSMFPSRRAASMPRPSATMRRRLVAASPFTRPERRPPAMSTSIGSSASLPLATTARPRALVASTPAAKRMRSMT